MLTWLKVTLLPVIASGLIRLLGRTMSLRTEGNEPAEALSRHGQRFIFAFWHAHQLMMPLAYRGSAARRLYILISQHRDGELIQQAASRFGFQSVRGSSTRGGVAAFRELVRLGKSGVDFVVTPDGPRGPRQVAKIGVVQLAKSTGLPIVPVTFGCSKKKCSRAGIASWFRIHSAEACFFGGRPFGSHPTPGPLS